MDMAEASPMDAAATAALLKRNDRERVPVTLVSYVQV